MNVGDRFTSVRDTSSETVPEQSQASGLPATRARVLLILSMGVLYVAAYVLLDPRLGNATGILATVPVVAAGLLLGIRGGFIAALLFFPVHTLVVMLLPYVSWHEWAIDGGGWLGSGALIAVGSLVGWLRDMRLKLREETRGRRLAQEQLQKANQDLDKRIQERTQELRRTNELLQREIKEKEVLLQEVHHRVRNNLQIMYSLNQLQTRHAKDSQISELLQDNQNRIRSIALVHEELYQTPNVREINIADYLEKLVDGVFRSYETRSTSIKWAIDAEKLPVDRDIVVSCGMVINELVTNCVKHAFPDGKDGEIQIELRTDRDQEFALRISDDGVGMPKEVDFRNTESLGLKLVNTLVNQMGGTIELERNGGTAFVFSVPRRKGRQPNIVLPPPRR